MFFKLRRLATVETKNQTVANRASTRTLPLRTTRKSDPWPVIMQQSCSFKLACASTWEANTQRVILLGIFIGAPPGNQKAHLVATVSLQQNRRQNVVNREALRLCGGSFRSCRGGLDIQIDKNSTNLQCFIFQIGGAWSFVWGRKLSKPPRGNGTGLQ